MMYVGTRLNLTGAVLDEGWPLMDECRGKAMFVLLATGDMRDLYMDERPGLVGAKMFPMFTSQGQYPGEEVIFSLTDPITDGEEITRLVEEGFIVRTRADSGGVEPDNNDTTRFEAALASGAHTIATDYPGPVDGMEYWIDIPEGNPSRCNPVVAPIWCTKFPRKSRILKPLFDYLHCDEGNCQSSTFAITFISIAIGEGRAFIGDGGSSGHYATEVLRVDLVVRLEVSVHVYKKT